MLKDQGVGGHQSDDLIAMLFPIGNVVRDEAYVTPPGLNLDIIDVSMNANQFRISSIFALFFLLIFCQNHDSKYLDIFGHSL
ncbi:hypothetical protein DK846_08795 [Methanospirillum lacunae]|uniref:Uncharacterized protein n=1 Tax=Methanospirillum lacunae TaxID=668570 RepID=A0A2V2N774_9EURY|nr:hypothetical protein DK846_08795 [Methanospirillum lacunae]